jgi:Rps23 Pro-64 3,4-dihydroxylase Tpa1-like proline 4-hydroxylase
MIDYSLSDKLRVQYQTANPFPYIVIDNFLPEFLLKKCVTELKNHNEWFHNQEKWVEEFQVNKFYYPNYDSNVEDFSKKIPITNLIFDYLNSDSFIDFLQKLTGFDGLYRDPILLGGGIHKISNGGKLSVHVDYNTHPGTLKQRKLNLLIYLNENWKSEWEGNLELWDKKNWEKKIEVEPIFNRAVIFSIENAPHGHPIPLNTPEGIDRYSLALYYFTDETPESKHSVIFYKDEDLGITKKIDDIFKTT